MKEEKQIINWIPVIELAVLAFTTLGTTITLFIHSENKTDKYTERSELVIEGIRQDLREFHVKLATQDAEFKAYLMHQHSNIIKE